MERLAVMAGFVATRSRRLVLVVTVVSLAVLLANRCSTPVERRAGVPAAKPTLASAAAQTSTATPPPDAMIVIGAASDLTGSYSSGGTPSAEGRAAYIRYVNEKLGGVNGIKIRLSVVDTGYDINREVAAYKRFRDVDKVLAMNHMMSDAAIIVAPMAEEDGMVTTAVATPEVTFRGARSWFFANQPMLPDGGGAVFEWWYQNEWKKKNPDKEPKVGLVNADVAAGKAVARYFREMLRQWEIPIVVDMSAGSTIPDTTNYVMALKAKQADVVVGLLADNEWGILVKDMQRLGVNIPKISPRNNVFTPDLLKTMGPAAVGMYGPMQYNMWDEDKVEGVRILRQNYAEWFPGVEERRPTFYFGYTEEAITLEAIRIALENVGYDGLTKDIKKGRQAVREAMLQINGFDVKGIIPPVRYSLDDRRPFAKVKVVRVVDGAKIQPISDWLPIPEITPDMRNSKWWTS